jgi:hypothetical protein
MCDSGFSASESDDDEQPGTAEEELILRIPSKEGVP